MLTTEGSTSLCVRRVSVLLAGREREDGDDDEEELEDDDDKERDMRDLDHHDAGINGRWDAHQ